MSLSDLSVSLSSSDDEEPRRNPPLKRPPDRNRRVLKTRTDPYEVYNDIEFKNIYRLSKEVIMSLTSMVEAEIKPFTTRNQSLSALEQLLLTIRFFATGAFQNTVADHIRVHKSTACRMIKKVAATLAKLRSRFITMPTMEQDRSRIKREFYQISLFPNVIGAIDCTHIKIKCPGKGPQGKLYKNRKGYYSLNVQTVCDAKLRILDVVCHSPGSVQDITILNESYIRADFENGVYGSDYLVGDSGYPCRSYLLTPFLYPTTPSEHAYNQAHIQARYTVKRCFGALKRRFPCLSLGLRVQLETAINIIVACCVLHNVALDHNDQVEDTLELDDAEDRAICRVMDENTHVRSSLLHTHFRR